MFLHGSLENHDTCLTNFPVL